MRLHIACAGLSESDILSSSCRAKRDESSEDDFDEEDDVSDDLDGESA